MLSESEITNEFGDGENLSSYTKEMLNQITGGDASSSEKTDAKTQAEKKFLQEKKDKCCGCFPKFNFKDSNISFYPCKKKGYSKIDAHDEANKPNKPSNFVLTCPIL